MSSAFLGSLYRPSPSFNTTLFFLKNKKILEEWLSRMRPYALALASVLKLDHLVVYHGSLCLDELKCQAEDEKKLQQSNAQAEDEEKLQQSKTQKVEEPSDIASYVVDPVEVQQEKEPAALAADAPTATQDVKPVASSSQIAPLSVVGNYMKKKNAMALTKILQRKKIFQRPSSIKADANDHADGSVDLGSDGSISRELSSTLRTLNMATSASSGQKFQLEQQRGEPVPVVLQGKSLVQEDQDNEVKLRKKVGDVAVMLACALKRLRAVDDMIGVQRVCESIVAEDGNAAGSFLWLKTAGLLAAGCDDMANQQFCDRMLDMMVENKDAVIGVDEVIMENKAAWCCLAGFYSIQDWKSFRQWMSNNVR